MYILFQKFTNIFIYILYSNQYIKIIVIIYYMVNIIQHGSDGLGHQMYGLFTCMILHNVGDYKFSGCKFIKKCFNFQHLSLDERQKCKLYLIEAKYPFILLCASFLNSSTLIELILVALPPKSSMLIE